MCNQKLHWEVATAQQKIKCNFPIQVLAQRYLRSSIHCGNMGGGALVFCLSRNCKKTMNERQSRYQARNSAALSSRRNKQINGHLNRQYDLCTYTILPSGCLRSEWNAGTVRTVRHTINHKTTCFYIKSTAYGIETIYNTNVLMWEILQHSTEEKLQWSVNNLDPWGVQTISGQIQLSISH